MKKTILFTGLYSLLFFICALGQKENNVWTFGKNLGLDFNSGTPVLISTNIETIESSGSVCDASGALLFYSDGVSVFDKTHKVMPNGTGLKGGEYKSTTQGVAISPIPGEPAMYFIFTLDAIENSPASTGELYYSLIDMRLNAGKGDIVSGFKNRFLGKDMSEKMIVASACNKIWLITHDREKPVFYSWPISSSSKTPVAIPSTTPGKNYTRYIWGEMKMSKDFRSLYMVNGGGYFEGFSFNLHTGHVGDYLNIDSTIDAYSVEVSSDNKMIYIIDRENILQYDISLLPDLASVNASKNIITKGFSMRRGPDDKIYVNRKNSGEVSRINNPERYAAACNFEINVPGLSHTNKFEYLQFGNSTVALNGGEPDELIFTRIDTVLCNGTVATFSINEKYGTITWSDGSTTSKKEISTPGTYWRSYSKDCIGYCDTIVVKGFRKPDTVNRKVLDTTVCFLPLLEVKSLVSSDKYHWSDGGSDRISVFRNEDTRWVAALNKDKYCEFNIDTFSVSFTNFNIPLRDTSICLGDSLTLDAGVTDATAYQWSNGSDQSKIQANKESEYWVSVTVGTCSKTDTVTVYSRAFNLDLGREQTVCKGSRVLIDTKVADATYAWQDGSNNSTYYATDSGLYSVSVIKNGCTEKAELNVQYLDCVACLSIPNAFTPNFDGTNDLFRVISRCPALKYEILIVDRYGTVVFSTNQITQGWDGRFNGRELELGVYYYLIRVTFDRGLGIKEELFKGDVSLLR